jgi:hypothetical protein
MVHENQLAGRRLNEVGAGDNPDEAPVIDNEASVVFAVVHEQKHDDGTPVTDLRPLAGLKPTFCASENDDPAATVQVWSESR